VNEPAAPLAGIRVLDIATFIAAPFCGAVLADFGAEVIKVEQPGEGDPLRRFGTPTECGDTLVWLSEARNKRCVTLDLRTDEGARLFRALVAKSDVVLENFRPGTLERWRLGFEDLQRVNRGIIMLRVSAYGQTGPASRKPGFARIAHAFSGLTYLAGEPDRVPVVPGSTSLADYLSGLWGALGVLLALRARDANDGTGQCIDLGLYESIFRILDEIAPAYAKHGYVRERMGADTVNVVPHSHYRCADGVYVALACSSDKIFRRLTELMGRPELGSDPRYATAPARNEHRAQVNELVAAWTAQYPSAEVMTRCEAGEVPCGPIYSIADIFADAQYAARENLQRVRDERAGEVVIPAAIPRMSHTPPRFQHLGPALGAHNDDVFGGILGLAANELARLRAGGVI
jgi:crotonobetainyl-CoA:carnitine CoA-transferase CaiB-like acyl-CoA transferase